MARFNPVRFPPGFFDLPPDAGEALPLDVIAAWARSAQTEAAARDLLRPFTLHGTVACSDTAGLTRLSEQRSLIEILSMVSRPKELIHALGKACGGIAIGVWAADNTEMFYPGAVDPGRVVSMLLTVQDQVARECEVGVGMAVHTGTFYELGQGLYGPDADLVEIVAEDHTEAGEIVLSGGLRDLLDRDKLLLAPRDDLAAGLGSWWRVTGGPRLEGVDATDFHYPLPFTDEFFAGLSAYKRTRRTSVVPRPAFQDLTIVVVEREREDPDVPEVAVLNDLALAAAVKRVGGTLLEPADGVEVKTAGPVSIYAFTDARLALEFARRLRDALAGDGIEVKIGLDQGRVLLFSLEGGLMDLAGSPVNVASKLAQDLGRFGVIHLTADCAHSAGLVSLEVARVTVSGVTLEMVTA